MNTQIAMAGALPVSTPRLDTDTQRILSVDKLSFEELASRLSSGSERRGLCTRVTPFSFPLLLGMFDIVISDSTLLFFPKTDWQTLYSSFLCNIYKPV